MKSLMQRGRIKTSREWGPGSKKSFHLLLTTYFLFPVIFFVLPSTLFSQTLFTYGNHAVSKKEFLQAYNKNNTDSGLAKMSYADYLDLYLKFKLKVQAAIDAGMDTTATQRAELKSFRNQLSEGYFSGIINNWAVNLSAV